jgi:hypothetical protein
MTSTTLMTEIQTNKNGVSETINITGHLLSTKDIRAKSPLRTHSDQSVMSDKSITDEKRTVSFPVDVITSKTSSSNGLDGTSETDTESQKDTSAQEPRPIRSYTAPIPQSPKRRPNSMTALTDEQSQILPQRSATTVGKAKKNILALVENDTETLGKNKKKEGKLRRRNTFNADGFSGDTALYEERQKVAENVKRRLSKRRTREKDKDYLDEEVMIGTRIGEDHANYVLMYNMLTGIRVGVSL